MYQPIEVTPWEVEATRRREVIAADFGAARAPLTEGSRSARRMGPVRRFAGWISAFAQPDGGASTKRVAATKSR